MKKTIAKMLESKNTQKEKKQKAKTQKEKKEILKNEILKKTKMFLKDEKKEKEKSKNSTWWIKKSIFKKKMQNELTVEKKKRNWIEIKKSKLENFSLFKNELEYNTQVAFYEKDFFIHNIELVKDEKKEKLLHLYNKIESIWKGLNLDEIEKIILENLKKRLIIEYCNNFENNLKKKNAKDIKNLNLFFQNSHLKQYIKNAKENENLNIFSDEKENIFWKSNNNFESRYIEKVNKKFIIDEIEKKENEKIIENLKKKKNWLDLDWKEKEIIVNWKNKLLKMKKNIENIDNIKSEYNLKSKTINNSINNNRFLIKINNSIDRIKRKVYNKYWLDEKEKFYKEKLKEYIEKWKEKKAKMMKKNIDEIKEKKKEIELKIYWIYENKIEKIILHAKNTKWKEYKKYLKWIQNWINKNKKIIEYIQNEYKYLLDE